MYRGIWEELIIESSIDSKCPAVNLGLQEK